MRIGKGTKILTHGYDWSVLKGYILKLTNTECRLLTNYTNFDILDNKIDKEEIQRILTGERNKGLAFLKKAL